MLRNRPPGFSTHGKHHFPFAVRVYGFHYLRERNCSAGSNYRGSRKTCPSPAPVVDPAGTSGVDSPRICSRRPRSARCPQDSRRRLHLETEKSPARLTSGTARGRRSEDARKGDIRIVRMLDVFSRNCADFFFQIRILYYHVMVSCSNLLCVLRRVRESLQSIFPTISSKFVIKKK